MSPPVNPPHLTPNRRRRILMLHGYAQNATVFSRRMAAIRKACADQVEMVFIDAPHILYPVDFTTNVERKTVDVPDKSVEDHALAPRGWWAKADSREINTAATGLGTTLQYLRDYLTHERFDAIFGFSQGAAMAIVVSTLLEKPHLYEPFLVDGKPVHPPFERGICVGAFVPGDPISKPLLATPFTTPFLHIYGEHDAVVVEEEARKAIDLNSSPSKRVLTHIGGHFVPVTRHWRQFFVDYIRTWSKNPGPVSPLPTSSDLLNVLSTEFTNTVPSH